MAPTYPLPAFIYKIVPTPVPSPLPDTLPLSELDAADGFIHLSTAEQTPVTASLFFAQSTELWLLKVDTRKTLDAGGVYAWVEGMPRCPHLYAPTEGEWLHLGRGNVAGVNEVKRGDGQTWAEAFKQLDRWLADE
ncbi:uncharacterized protein BXZ73DRAFT_91274 [Epithele typhae]|uniref:uncharacterized protein n=1 Tax=Epithele typhae TaxID=378194 RepID=UPI0020073408|nr:uncharacterized protein BXZ73DRAFT_91274 [Epithele typhae]KAH9924270.1 hypothetical protein BXZ73DRAFT_91274 [Epithele typhae]